MKKKRYLTVEIEEELLRRARIAAAKLNISRSELVRRILRESLNKMEKEKEQ